MGDKEDDLLEDISFVTNSTLVDNENIKVESLSFDHFGSCKKIIIDKEKTHIVGGKGKVSEHLKEIYEKL